MPIVGYSCPNANTVCCDPIDRIKRLSLGQIGFEGRCSVPPEVRLRIFAPGPKERHPGRPRPRPHQNRRACQCEVPSRWCGPHRQLPPWRPQERRANGHQRTRELCRPSTLPGVQMAPWPVAGGTTASSCSSAAKEKTGILAAAPLQVAQARGAPRSATSRNTSRMQPSLTF